jgi:hypothetical protein
LRILPKQVIWLISVNADDFYAMKMVFCKIAAKIVEILAKLDEFG